MTALTAFLFVLVALIARSKTLRCLQCQGINSECNAECEGDFCILWKYREMSIDYRIQGCASGVSRSDLAMSCRRNLVDAVLCLCDHSNYCNEDRLQYLREEDTVNFTAQIRCNSHTKAPFISHKSVITKGYCMSDLCHFSRKTTVTEQGVEHMVETASCGQMRQYNFDFLIGPLWPSVGLGQNACYKIELQHNQSQIGCTCTMHNCNRHLPYQIRGNPMSTTGGNDLVVRCHLAFGDIIDEDLMESQRNSFLNYCTGEFCVLQRIIVPEYGRFHSKGCLSTSNSPSIKTGYRRVLNVEQWLCATDFCNFNMESARSGGVHAPSRMRLDASTATLPTKWRDTPPRRKIAKNSVGGRVRAQNSANERIFSGTSRRKSNFNFYTLLLIVILTLNKHF